ncbi:hypothetical protein BCV72DRAFT_22403 [Rhizopus microsporus var. microsporus]|uniref:Uncharacterized protein n=1 Tax=Rhizopus microsporus var. microsporus TaxID=86635 RepID=A0A1X0QW68_RHIZD|nr:hypothetical protein BCV72DRAFT_22403 [Rhizopus microsporus var. microsporus]
MLLNTSGADTCDPKVDRSSRGPKIMRLIAGINCRVVGAVRQFGKIDFLSAWRAEDMSARNENMGQEIIRNLSGMLAQFNPFARIYRHAYEISSNHESSNINSKDISNNNGSTESESPYIVINP